MNKQVKASLESAYQQVFGAACEANAKYTDKNQRDGNGVKVYAQQIRKGKTKRDHGIVDTE